SAARLRHFACFFGPVPGFCLGLSAVCSLGSGLCLGLPALRFCQAGFLDLTPFFLGLTPFLSYLAFLLALAFLGKTPCFFRPLARSFGLFLDSDRKLIHQLAQPLLVARQCLRFGPLLF